MKSCRYADHDSHGPVGNLPNEKGVDATSRDHSICRSDRPFYVTTPREKN